MTLLALLCLFFLLQIHFLACGNKPNLRFKIWSTMAARSAAHNFVQNVKSITSLNHVDMIKSAGTGGTVSTPRGQSQNLI